MSVKSFFIALAIVISSVLLSPAWAECIFLSGNGSDGIVTFQMPAVIRLAPDTPVGTVIYEDSAQSSQVLVKCGGEDAQIRRGYISLNDADARDYILPGVYKTNVPGIGIRAAASTMQFPSYNDDNLVRPFHYVGAEHGYLTETPVFRVAAQLVVIGDVQDGDLDTSRLTAVEMLDNIVIGEMRFSPTSVRITTNTCNLVDKNIYVPLKTVHAQDFTGQYSGILTDSSFKIDITDCAAGTKIDYQFKSAGSTGVSGQNILHIADGNLAASGVGIQILDSHDNVLNFDQDYTAISSTGDNVPVEIPLKARYVKTGELKAGKVDSVATFEVFYR